MRAREMHTQPQGVYTARNAGLFQAFLRSSPILNCRRARTNAMYLSISSSSVEKGLEAE